MEQNLKYLQSGFWGRSLYRIRKLLQRVYGGFIRPDKNLKKAGNRKLDKAAAACAYIIPGAGHLLHLRIEKGLAYLAFAAFYIWFMITAGAGSFTGRGIFSGLKTFGIIVTVLLSVLFCFLYPKSVSDTINYIQRINTDNPKREQSIFKRIFKGVRVRCSVFSANIGKAYRGNSIRQKAAVITGFTVPGISALVLGQVIKGIFKLLLTAVFIWYMVVRGAGDITGLITLRTEGVKSNYNIVFGLIALFITAAFIMVYIINIRYSVISAAKLSGGEGLPKFLPEFRALFNKKLYILFLGIPVAGVLVFTILPLIYMISIAFTNFATTETLGVIPNTVKNIYLSWTGFSSFIKLFTLNNYFSAFAGVLSWTLIWAFLATFTCYFGGLFLAMLINKKIVKCKVIFRSLFVLSIAVPQLVTLRVMYAMFHDYGPINALLIKWGLISQRISFWGNVNIAKPLILLINMWVGIPYFMLLMSGLLINIPQDLYEYAKVEGAGKFYVFRKITMPYLLFMTAPLLITNFVSNINNFNVIWLLTGGGPGGQGTGGVAGGTDILITWLYKLTMQHNPDYNIGSAIGIIMFIISAGLSLIVYRNSSSYKQEGDFA